MPADDPPSVSPGELPVLFERRGEAQLVTGLDVVVILVAAASLVGAMASGLVGALLAALAPIVGEPGVFGGLTVVTLLAASSSVVLRFARGRRRFARCILSAERARFIEDGLLARTIEREALRGWRQTPHGLLLDADPWPLRAIWPYLVPTNDAVELALAEALLRGEDPLARRLITPERVAAARRLVADLEAARAP